MITVFSPSAILLGAFVFLNLLPGLFLYLFDVQEGLYFPISSQRYSIANLLYLYSVALFLFSFCLSRYFIFAGDVWWRRTFTSVESLRKQVLARRRAFVRLPVALAIIGAVSIWIYFAAGGYEKLLVFGSDIDSWEFRLIGYDDRSRLLIAALEAARRVLLPYAALYFVVLRSIGVDVPRKLVFFLLFTQFVGAVVTLDRAPILLFFVMLMYVRLCRGGGVWFAMRMLSVIFAVTIVTAGLVTFVQYNLQEFSLLDIVTTGFDFFFHRTVLVPSIASIELSFDLFPAGSEKLHLAFSRLTALFTGDYIGSQEDLSIYVTPVGAVADIWRNFGIVGIAVVGVWLGWYFKQLDQFVRRASPVGWIVGTFNVFSLCFYYIFGLFFSQGVFFQMTLMYWLLSVESRQFRQMMRARSRPHTSDRPAPAGVA